MKNKLAAEILEMIEMHGVKATFDAFFEAVEQHANPMGTKEEMKSYTLASDLNEIEVE